MTAAGLQRQDQPDMTAAALAYARKGLAVFPIWSTLPLPNGALACGCARLNCESPAKHPIGRLAPHGVTDATSDEERVRRFWACRPDANIGFATGVIIVVDIDPKNGGTFAALEQRGPLPPTWRVATGGGGQHLFFRAPAEGEIRNSAGKLGTGIDVRGAGGYVVLPPSQHISGNRYAWQIGYGLETVLAPLPSWLSIALREKRYDLNAVGQPGAAWHELVAGNVSEGARNNTITRLAGHLLRHYVDPRVVLELLLSWNATRCSPPLSPAEVAKTVNSIASRELKRRQK